MRRLSSCLALLAIACPSWLSPAAAAELPIVPSGDWAGFREHVTNVVDAIDKLGAPFAAGDKDHLLKLLRHDEVKASPREVQEILDALCLVGVNVNPESRVKVQRGPATALLESNKTGVFLAKVHNEAGVTQPLRVTGPHVATNGAAPTGDRWLTVKTHDAKPLRGKLSGRTLEYVILVLRTRQTEKREAKLVFDVGQGTQDLGFRAEVPVLFTIQPDRSR